MTTPAHSGFSRWLTARLAEPESRIAVAGAITALATYAGGQTSLSTLGYALLAAALAFVLPGPLAQEVAQAIEHPGAAIVPSAWTPITLPQSQPVAPSAPDPFSKPDPTPAQPGHGGIAGP